MSETMSVEKAKERAKERDDWQCRFCSMTEEEHQKEHGRGLHAHHIIKSADGGPDKPRNLITVCQDCHSIIEHTQSEALSQIKDLILRDVRSEFVAKEEVEGVIQESVVTQGSLEAEVEWQLKQSKPDTVKRDHFYKHSDYGVVLVRGFETETTAATKNGTVENVLVEFTDDDSEDNLERREPLEMFNKKTGDSHPSSRFAKEEGER